MTPPFPRLRLSGFRPVAPRYFRSQADALRWLAQAHAESAGFAAEGSQRELSYDSILKLLTRFGCGPDRISKRGYELEDFSHHDWESMRLFNLKTGPSGERIEARNRFFDEAAERVLDEIFPESESAPEAALHVTCTGYSSPSALQRVISRRGWGEFTQVHHVYHMGCYASLPAIRAAAGLLVTLPEGARARVAHTELCTLHLRPDHREPESLVIQSLFADGHMGYDVSFANVVANVVSNDRKGGFEVLAIADRQIPESSPDMRWWLTDFSMGMALSRDVPSKIGEALPGAIQALAAIGGTRPENLRREAVWAIHPGGPKIIDQIASQLGLSDGQVAASRKVLFENGNMSSATLPHVWKEIVEDDRVPAGTPVVSLAFGPGLTVAGAVFVKVE